MKTLILIPAALALVAFAAGCSGAVRDANTYRDDTGKALAAKDPDIRACYDDVLKANPAAAGKVTVKFDVETEGGKIQNVAVDKANTTAPETVSECVTKSINGIAITPADARKGEGTWVYEFAPPAKS